MGGGRAGAATGKQSEGMSGFGCGWVDVLAGRDQHAQVARNCMVLHVYLCHAPVLTGTPCPARELASRSAAGQEGSSLETAY